MRLTRRHNPGRRDASDVHGLGQRPLRRTDLVDGPVWAAMFAPLLGTLLATAAACAPTSQLAPTAPTPATQTAKPGAASPAPSPAAAAPAPSSPASSPVAAGSPAGSPAAQAQRWTFDSDPAGGPPQGAQAFSGTWAVRGESDAPSPPNVLCQTGEAEFPALQLGDGLYADLVVSTRFKPISGREDQAAGLIFRIQDKDNYYILRANALEDNVNFFKYQGGRRSGLKEAPAKVPSGQWQELRLEVRGNVFRGFLNGQPVVDVTDDTFKNAGRVGLWTKSDSVTCFDDVQVQAQ
jgi:Domain of Unknown Function (DUF1080)